MFSFMNDPTVALIVATIIKGAILIVILLTAFAYMTLIERRLLAFFQGRLGPNRAGPLGLFQPIADAVKMAFKEQIIPTQASKAIYLIAPVISVIVALSAFAVIPVGNYWSGSAAHPSIWDPFIGNINVGILFILAFSSLAVYGIVLGGWSSGNHYSLLGALRSAAQMVSYETSLGLALGGTLIWASTLNMQSIVQQQTQGWFIAAQPLGFVIYLIAAFAEVNRAPFDLPEAEQELTAGYLTEYSGLRWSLYQMSEYINMFTVSSIAASFFLGGWSLFGVTERFPWLSIFVYAVKVAFFLFIFIWVRATLPRIRYDRLMTLGWQVLLPLAVLNMLVVACVVAFNWGWWVSGLFGVIVIVAAFIIIRQRGLLAGVRREESKGEIILPSSVHLAKFERVGPSASAEEQPESQGLSGTQDTTTVRV
jgi:NADH:ubiquinone oxidoreductase subunit 1 (chain H)